MKKQQSRSRGWMENEGDEFSKAGGGRGHVERNGERAEKVIGRRRKVTWSASCAKGNDRLVKRMRNVDLMRESTTRNAARRHREVGPEYKTRRIDLVQLRGSPAVR